MKKLLVYFKLEQHLEHPKVHAHFTISCLKHLVRSFSIGLSSNPNISRDVDNNSLIFSYNYVNFTLLYCYDGHDLYAYDLFFQ